MYNIVYTTIETRRSPTYRPPKERTPTERPLTERLPIQQPPIEQLFTDLPPTQRQPTQRPPPDRLFVGRRSRTNPHIKTKTTSTNTISPRPTMPQGSPIKKNAHTYVPNRDPAKVTMVHCCVCRQYSNIITWPLNLGQKRCPRNCGHYKCGQCTVTIH
jgi:hypothetical protein